MKIRKTVKTNIIKMLKKYPHKHRYEMLGMELGITSRYVRMLEKGEAAPSANLRKLIRLLLNNKED